MKTKLLFTLLLSILLSTAKAKDEIPTIQAICKITLNDGKAFEGLITLGYGREQGLWMNGFYFNCFKSNQENVRLFDFQFKKFYETQFGFVLNDQGGGMDCSAVKFIQWIDNPTIDNPRKITIDSSHIEIITHLERNYKMMDSLTLFLELPSSIFLDDKRFVKEDSIKKVKQTKVAVKDISRFELVDKPSQTWLDLIEKQTKTIKETNNKNGNTDFLLPAWYHTIIGNARLESKYSYYIRFGYDR